MRHETSNPCINLFILPVVSGVTMTLMFLEIVVDQRYCCYEKIFCISPAGKHSNHYCCYYYDYYFIIKT